MSQNTITIIAVCFINGILFAGFSAWRTTQLKKGEAGATNVRRAFWAVMATVVLFFGAAFLLTP